MLLPNKLTGVSWLRGISCPQTALAVSLSLSTLNKRNTTLNYATKKKRKKRRGSSTLTCCHWYSPSCVNVLLRVCAWVSVRQTFEEARGSPPLHCNLPSRHTYRPCPVTWQLFARLCLCSDEEGRMGEGGRGREGRRERRREEMVFVLIKFKYWFFLEVRYSACNVWFVDFVDFNLFILFIYLFVLKSWIDVIFWKFQTES